MAEEQVKNPKHHEVLDGVTTIDLLASLMTIDEFYGFCLGNILKYRLRAGKKDDAAQDIAKADYYLKLYELHKGECKPSNN